MRVLTAVGARPQFIKCAPVSRALRRQGVQEVLVHSGQHFDDRMSQVFFDELQLPPPEVNLGVGAGSHGAQTGRMLEGFEEVIRARRPDWVLVHGDTNSTLAAALAAVKLGVPVAHNEAGLRSFNRAMPEEHNRVLTDHCADLLACPTQAAVDQLAREGLVQGVHNVGDVMYDAVLQFRALAGRRARARAELGLTDYLLLTLHRPYTVDDPARLGQVLRALADAPAEVVLPCHPRLARRLAEYGLPMPARVRRLDPVGYLDMLDLEQHARAILTDSGGVQKEAFFLGVPCLTLRPETEWRETLVGGWNRLVDTDERRIRAALHSSPPPAAPPSCQPFGDGRAADKLVEALVAGPGRG